MRSEWLRLIPVLFLACLFSFGQSASPTITVAAASDLNPALTELAGQYRRQTGAEVKISYGSSGNLASQLENGAPYDLFFSGDESYPQQLVLAGLADNSTFYRYAIGRLVLWVPASSPLDLDRLGMQVLLDPSVKKIAMANPQHAPYGRAAEAALRRFHLFEKLSSRLVLGENVSQAAQFVESGSAQAGLIAYSRALSPARQKGRYWVVPPDSYPPLNQAVVLLSRSSRREPALDFLKFLKSPAAVALLRQYGFGTPEAKP